MRGNKKTLFRQKEEREKERMREREWRKGGKNKTFFRQKRKKREISAYS
jgi:hypothetical protein